MPSFERNVVVKYKCHAFLCTENDNKKNTLLVMSSFGVARILVLRTGFFINKALLKDLLNEQQQFQILVSFVSPLY